MSRGSASRTAAPDPHTGGPSRFPLIAADEARAVLARFRALGTEEIPVERAAGRVLAGDVRARGDVPHFARSYMDGYAVRAADTAGAAAGRPVRLRVTATIEMGRGAGRALRAGEAQRIPTGGMLPRGADAVVMVEHTGEDADGTVAIAHAARAGEHVMHRGDDVRRGALVFPRGRRLRPGDVGALSGIGVGRVRVHRQPVVAIIATGDEIVPPDVRPGPGQVRNVNQYALRALVAAEGGRVLDLGVQPDRPRAITGALARALRDADLVLMSGGTSVGTKDLGPGIVAGLPRARVLVHGIRIKPGKPTLVASVGGTPLLGIPGNPTSAMVIFHLFGIPLLRIVGGEPPAQAFAPRARAVARLTERVPSQVGREDWLRVKLEEDADGLVCRPLAGGSGEIVHFALADGLARIPAEAPELPAGARVAVHLLV